MADDWTAQEEAFFGKAISKPSDRSNAVNGVKKNDAVTSSLLGRFKDKASKREWSSYPAAAANRRSLNATFPNPTRPTIPSKAIATPQFNSKPRTPSTGNPQQPSFFHRPSSNSSNGRNTNNNNNNKKSWSNLYARANQSINQKLKNMVPSCTVCGIMAPTRYHYHPFFPNQKACIHHTEENGELIICSSCKRYEPCSKYGLIPFEDLQDNGRKICPACIRTIIVDSQDAAPLWKNVVSFFDQNHSMFTNDGYSEFDLRSLKLRMESIPIVIVDHDGLNDPCVKGSGHGKGNTRGLCMFEYRYIPGLSTIKQRYERNGGGNLRHFLQSKSSQSTNGVFQSVLSNISNALPSSSSANVTAILCLKGLPSDLVSSILAHEATHAWLKLHPSYDPTCPVPLQVEEGCCQLMAYLYLSYLDEGDHQFYNKYIREDNQPTDYKLRQYFRYCVETDPSEIYGEGYRQAAAAYSKIQSIAALLEHVAIHKKFPS